jgi:predicted nucleotidyltransferase
MHPFIHQNQSAIAELCRRYRVQRLEVFGSAARGTDFAPESSGADFLVEFSPSSDSPPPCATPISKLASIEVAKSSMQCDPRAYLWDAMEAAAAILEFVAGKTFKAR